MACSDNTSIQIITGIGTGWNVNWGKALEDNVIVVLDHYSSNDD